MADIEQITIRELLRDPQYRAYFTKKPLIPDHYTPEVKPWKLMVMKKGETIWRAKRFGTYKEAFQGFKILLPKLHDAAINCPGLDFMPPVRNVKVKGRTDAKGRPIVRTLVWKPQLAPDMGAHYWCGHCRRPAVFVNKAMSPRMLNGLKLPASKVAFRCSICGASEEIMDIRRPETNQRWDTNRPRIFEVHSA